MNGSEVLRKPQVVVITVAVRGIGRTVAERLADDAHDNRDEIKNNLTRLFANSVVCKHNCLNGGVGCLTTIKLTRTIS